MMNIVIENLSDNTQVNYPLVMIAGRIESSESSFLSSANECVDECISVLLKNVELKWPVFEKKFKLFVQLDPGRNEVVLCCSQASKTLHFEFKMDHNRKRKIHLFYIRCCDDDEGRFQTPDGVDSSPEMAMKKLEFNCQLLQCFCAEKFEQNHFKRRTFSFETNPFTGLPRCHFYQLKHLTMAEASQMDQKTLWRYLSKELTSHDQKYEDCFVYDLNVKFLTFLSFTRYHPPAVDEGEAIPQTHKEILQRTTGYCALGGGNLAVLGTACLFTWASDLTELLRNFSDETIVDRSKLMDDSCNRRTYAGCYATTLGAALHELGHVFDLGHSTHGIMSRGFDDLHLFFLPSSNRKYSLIQRLPITAATSDNPVKVAEEPKSLISTTLVKLREEGGGMKVKRILSYSDGTNDVILSYLPSGGDSEPRIALPRLSSSSTSARLLNDGAISPMGTLSVTSRADDTRKVKKDVTAGDWKNSGQAEWSWPHLVMLSYHRWFNDYEDDDLANEIAFDGQAVSSSHGLVVIELLNESGVAFQSWNLTDLDPVPRRFRLRLAGIEHQSHVGETITIIAEDTRGAVLRKTLPANSLLS